VTRLRVGRPEFDSGWDKEEKFFSSPPRLDRFWGPPSLLYNGYQGDFSAGIERSGREADHSPSAEVNNEWNYNSTPHKFSLRGG
jgi:hypothetical protein